MRETLRRHKFTQAYVRIHNCEFGVTPLSWCLGTKSHCIGGECLLLSFGPFFFTHLRGMCAD
jgi:hypothetical protein